MEAKQKSKPHNRLWLARQRAGLPQKVVAALLNHKTTDQISRYERDVRMPSLRMALKLEIILGVPVRVLFQEQYEQACRKVVEKLKLQQTTGKNIQERLSQIASNEQICTYLELLTMPNVSQAELIPVRKHVTEIMKKMAYM